MLQLFIINHDTQESINDKNILIVKYTAYTINNTSYMYVAISHNWLLVVKSYKT